MTTTNEGATLRYLTGDATAPQGDGAKIIAHVCNDQGGWGAGFVLALSARWAEPEARYRSWCASGDSFELGMCQLVSVEPDVWVANMVAQHAYKSPSNPVAVRYDALATCLDKLAGRALELQASVHMPRIGAGLAGGDWNRIERVIEDTLVKAGVNCVVYDLP
jgi:O-acetyl-ADP-ribose deacetylase (regulator of RNase III)